MKTAAATDPSTDPGSHRFTEPMPHIAYRKRPGIFVSTDRDLCRGPTPWGGLPSEIRWGQSGWNRVRRAPLHSASHPFGATSIKMNMRLAGTAPPVCWYRNKGSKFLPDVISPCASATLPCAQNFDVGHLLTWSINTATWYWRENFLAPE